jgi:hypothetical protein
MAQGQVDCRCYQISYRGPVSVTGNLLEDGSEQRELCWGLIRRLGTTNWLLRQAKLCFIYIKQRNTRTVAKAAVANSINALATLHSLKVCPWLKLAEA